MYWCWASIRSFTIIFTVLLSAEIIVINESLIEIYAENTVPNQPKMKKLYDAHQKITDIISYQQKNQTATALIIFTQQRLSTQTESASFEVPLFLSYVNSSSNKLVVGIDYRSSFSIEESKTRLESLIGQDVPMEIGFGFFQRDSCNFPYSVCTPLIGGIKVVSPTNSLQGTGTLGLPVSNIEGVTGFIMSGHTAGDGAKDIPIGQVGFWNGISDLT